MDGLLNGAAHPLFVSSQKEGEVGLPHTPIYSEDSTVFYNKIKRVCFKQVEKFRKNGLPSTQMKHT
jgi:hypothetical protein